MSIKILNMAYNKDQNFNSYLKNNNSCIDIDYPIEASFYEYQKVLNRADNSFMESSKDSMFNVFRTMATTGFFNNSDIGECVFDKIIFNLTYVTSDRQRISFHFMYNFSDILKIKDRLNREEALSYMNYLGKY
jgi:hypothetical protein